MIRTPAMALAAAALAAGLASCGPGAPANRKTAQAMPDTSRPEANPPDASVTGVVPKEGPPPMQPDQNPDRPSLTGQPDVPVDVPEVQPK
jgi:hypothetical protein